MTKNILSVLKISAVAIALALGATNAYAWSAPTLNPPAGNIDTPINVGGSDQIKTGAITAWSFTAPYFRLATTTTAGYVLTSDAIGNASWEAATGGSLPAGTAGQTIRHNGASWIANSVIFNNGTNVGIGTTAPGYPLDVNGNIRSRSWIVLASSTTALGGVRTVRSMGR